jgi:hypothetical protein
MKSEFGVPIANTQTRTFSKEKEKNVEYKSMSFFLSKAGKFTKYYRRFFFSVRSKKIVY